MRAWRVKLRANSTFHLWGYHLVSTLHNNQESLLEYLLTVSHYGMTEVLHLTPLILVYVHACSYSLSLYVLSTEFISSHTYSFHFSYPVYIPEFMAYMSIIKCQKHFEGLEWFACDRAFCRQVTTTKSLQQSKTDSTGLHGKG